MVIRDCFAGTFKCLLGTFRCCRYLQVLQVPSSVAGTFKCLQVLSSGVSSCNWLKTNELCKVAPAPNAMNMNVNDHKGHLPTAWQSPELPGLEILHGTFRDHEFPRHYHDGLMISIIDEGAQVIRYKGTSHIAGPGRIVAIAAGEVHAGHARSGDGWRYRVFTVPDSMVASLLRRHAQSFTSDVVIDDLELAEKLRAAHAAFSRPATKLEREELLLLALDRFFESHVHPALLTIPRLRNERAVRRAVEYLSDNFGCNVALAELAAATGLDAFHLTRTFTRAMGMPPHAYHLQQRLRAVQARLAAGESATKVAQDFGFSDQAHLTRLFKRLTGVTPGRYRAAHGHPPRQE
jgi:AraC-like DNA-binding protein